MPNLCIKLNCDIKCYLFNVIVPKDTFLLSYKKPIFCFCFYLLNDFVFVFMHEVKKVVFLMQKVEDPLRGRDNDVFFGIPVFAYILDHVHF